MRRGKNIFLTCLGLALLLVSGMTAHGKVAEVDCASAEEVVRRQLSRAGYQLGFDQETSSIVYEQSERFSRCSEQSAACLGTKRDAMFLSLFLGASANVAKAISARMPLQKTDTSGAGGKDGVATSVSISARCLLCGMKTIAEAMSEGENQYEVAAAFSWSKGLDEAARAVLSGDLGKGDSCKSGMESLEAWLGNQDWEAATGPRQYVDNNGVRHFLASAARELTGEIEKDEVSRESARASARSYLLLSLRADCSLDMCHTYCSSRGKSSLQLNESLESMSLVSMRELVCRETVSPISGKKLFVSVWGTNVELGNNGRGCQKECYSNASTAIKDVASVSGILKAMEGKGGTGDGFHGSAVIPFDSAKNDLRCLGSAFRGEASFSWRKGERGFAEKYEAAFYEAYIKALEKVVLATPCEYQVRCSKKCDKVHEELAKVDCSQGPTVSCQGRGGGWKFCRLQGMTMSEFVLPMVGSRGLSMSGKLPVYGNFSVSECCQYDPGEGVFGLSVDVKFPKFRTGAKSLSDFISEVDFSRRIGCRRYCDDEGVVWVIGIGWADIPDGRVTKEAKQLSQAKALRSLCLAYGAEVDVCCQSKLNYGKTGDGELCACESVVSQACLTMAPEVYRTFSKLPKRHFAGIEEHPATGVRAYVTVYAIGMKSK